MNNLIALTEDSSVWAVEDKGLDQAVDRRQGFVWVLLICLDQHRKVLQDVEICVYQAIENIMKTKKALETPWKNYLPWKKVPSQGTEGPDQSFTYQGIVVKRYESGFTNNYTSLVEAVESCLRKHQMRICSLMH